MSQSNLPSIETSLEEFVTSAEVKKLASSVLTPQISSLTMDELLRLKEDLLAQTVQSSSTSLRAILIDALFCISDQITNLRKMEQKDIQIGAMSTALTSQSDLFPVDGLIGGALQNLKTDPKLLEQLKGSPSLPQAPRDTEYPDNNPKTAFGAKKLPLDVVPPSAVHAMARGFADGARKYNAYNWREKTISSSVYYGAALRHLMAWWDGEERAEDSGLSHLDHALCCIAMIVDGASVGKLNDNRPPKGASSEMQKEWLKKNGT